MASMAAETATATAPSPSKFADPDPTNWSPSPPLSHPPPYYSASAAPAPAAGSACCTHCGASLSHQATPPANTHNGSGTGSDDIHDDDPAARLVIAQRQIEDLQTQVRLLSQKATSAADRWAEYEDELSGLRQQLYDQKRRRDGSQDDGVAITTTTATGTFAPKSPASMDTIRQAGVDAASATPPPSQDGGSVSNDDSVGRHQQQQQQPQPQPQPQPQQQTGRSSFLGASIAASRISQLLTTRSSRTTSAKQQQVNTTTAPNLKSFPPSPTSPAFSSPGIPPPISEHPAHPIPQNPNYNPHTHDHSPTALSAQLAHETALRRAAEGKLATTTQEIEELSTSLFEQANEMVAQERRARARLEERVVELEQREGDKRRRLERLEGAVGRIERLRRVLREGE